MKIKIRLILVVFALSSINIFAQSSSLISSCNEFVSGPNSTWPFVLVATTPADSAASQGSQTYTMNVTSLPSGGANFRVYKTTANGNSFLLQVQELETELYFCNRNKRIGEVVDERTKMETR